MSGVSAGCNETLRGGYEETVPVEFQLSLVASSTSGSRSVDEQRQRVLSHQIRCVASRRRTQRDHRTVTRVAAFTPYKPAFHDADTDSDSPEKAYILTSDTRDFLKLFLWQAERHADILATILARMSVSVSA